MTATKMRKYRVKVVVPIVVEAETKSIAKSMALNAVNVHGGLIDLPRAGDEPGHECETCAEAFNSCFVAADGVQEEEDMVLELLDQCAAAFAVIHNNTSEEHIKEMAMECFKNSKAAISKIEVSHGR